MLNSTERILLSPLKGHVIREIDLANLFTGTPAKRYGLVNKAIKRKELLPLRRGLYTLAPQYQPELFSSYYLANQIVPYSFVTAESALQFHQWIPERISSTTSMTAFGRNKTFNTSFGQFMYCKNPLNLYDALLGVMRIEINSFPVLIATPLRALADYIYWHKIKTADSGFLKTGLRIEKELLRQFTRVEIEALISAYKAKCVRLFLKKLLAEIDVKND
jgi:hypothetical protein